MPSLLEQHCPAIFLLRRKGKGRQLPEYALRYGKHVQVGTTKLTLDTPNNANLSLNQSSMGIWAYVATIN